MLSLAFNIHFIATRPHGPSGVFNIVSKSVVELKAETEGLGTSYGSGVVLTTDGLIVTNAHVVTYSQLEQTREFEKVYIRFAHETDYRLVKIVMYDKALDIAILKLEGVDNLEPIKLGDSSKLKHGDTIYAIGNLSNHGISMTTGVVSIPNVEVSYGDVVRGVIQCDLTISEGNSGGALVDGDGKFLGLTTFRLKDSSNNVVYGISYSIPVNTILEYIKNHYLGGKNG